MKRYAPVYYLLFVMLIMGAFASMAQNDYGIKMIGFVAMVFAIVFAWQIFDKKNENGSLANIEAISLIIMAVILAMRVFYLRFAYVELIFAFAAVALIIVYVYKVVLIFREPSTNRSAAWTVAIFYSSVIFYLITIAMMPFAARFGNSAGLVGFALLVVFLLAVIFARKTIVDGAKIPAYKFVTRLHDRSFILISLFVLFTAYAGLTKLNALPPMYDSEFPRAYYQLINEAERGDVKLFDGKPKHEEYKRIYNRFVKRNKK